MLEVRGLAVHPGEIVVVTGPNGAGKSSLNRALAGLAPVAGGQVVWDGHEVTHQPFERRNGIALMPEGWVLAPSLTVEETPSLGAGPGRGNDQRVAAAATLARFPVLAARHRQLAGTLSGGEAQMLSLARALMSRTRLIFLDESMLGL